jgi:bifunctional DNase/RNase
MLIAVHIASFAVQADKNTPLVVLQETGKTRTVAVPVTASEASAIAIKSLNVACEKPLTIDVLKMAVDAFGARLNKVVVRAANEEFSARLYIHADSLAKIIECGAGDGIALAMRCCSPLFVNEEIFLEKGAVEVTQDTEALRKAIASTATLEFGTYYLQ